MMAKPAKHFYEFGAFRLDLAKRRLLRDGEVVPLTPKAFETLLVLVENCGHVVEKDDLMEKVWPGTVVEENNLSQNISALRKALGEKREEPHYILTVSGQGYRFVASVNESWGEKPTEPEDNLTNHPEESVAPNPALSESEEVQKNQTEQASAVMAQPSAPARRPPTTSWRPGQKAAALSALVVLLAAAGFYYSMARGSKRAVVTTTTRSLAVLPFKPLAAEASDEYLGTGLTDALITRLSNLKQVVVRPTSAVLKYAHSDRDPLTAGQELQVDSLLDGTVQKSGDQIRVTVQLVRVSDGRSLWAHTFDEKGTNFFGIEDKVAEEVAQALWPTLTGDEKAQLVKHYTEDTEAYEAYIKGRYFWNKRTPEGIKKGISCFEDAIIKDPNYALAYAGLADSYATMIILDEGRPDEIMRQAQSAALRALEIDDELAEAHASLGYVKHRFEWDWPGAEREFKRAIELNPSYATAHQWYGWYLVSVGSFDAALAEFQRAQHLNPLSLYINVTLGMPFFYSHQYDKAIEQYQRVTEMDPKFPLAHRWLGKAYEQKRMYGEALAEFQKYISFGGESVEQAPAIGYIYALSGKPAEARQILDKLLKTSTQRYVSAYSIAVIDIGLGEKDQAVEWLQRGVAEHGSDMVFINFDQRFDSLHSDPRFAELAHKIGFPQ